MKLNMMGMGKINSENMKRGMEEYKKRMGKFTKIDEFKEVRLAGKNPALVFTMGNLNATEKGKELGSEELAGELSGLMLEGYSTIDIFLELKNNNKAWEKHTFEEYNNRGGILKVNLCLGISDEELGWLLIYEQLYRGFTILNNIQYHK